MYFQLKLQDDGFIFEESIKIQKLSFFLINIFSSVFLIILYYKMHCNALKSKIGILGNMLITVHLNCKQTIGLYMHNCSFSQTKEKLKFNISLCNMTQK